jgi:hypothetical protein
MGQSVAMIDAVLMEPFLQAAKDLGYTVLDHQIAVADHSYLVRICGAAVPDAPLVRPRLTLRNGVVTQVKWQLSEAIE